MVEDGPIYHSREVCYWQSKNYLTLALSFYLLLSLSLSLSLSFSTNTLYIYISLFGSSALTLHSLFPPSLFRSFIRRDLAFRLFFPLSFSLILSLRTVFVHLVSLFLFRFHADAAPCLFYFFLFFFLALSTIAKNNSGPRVIRGIPKLPLFYQYSTPSISFFFACVFPFSYLIHFSPVLYSFRISLYEYFRLLFPLFFQF